MNIFTDFFKGKDPKNPQKSESRAQLERIRQDIGLWRTAQRETESAWNPYRVKIQQLYLDTVNNGHVYACMQRRKDLSLLKEFQISNEKGEEDEVITNLFKKKWFFDALSYILDAQFYGYSLIHFGDIINGEFKHSQVLKRYLISPDRHTYNSYAYTLNGWDFLDETKGEGGQSLFDWTLWVPTASDSGISDCGNGLLYMVGYYEIFIRNNTTWNADFNEIFGQPTRWAKTTKGEGQERDDLERSLQQAGSSHYLITDPRDEIEFLTAPTGSGTDCFDNFEQRMEKKISKVILGHSDAMDSVPGKLGAQGGEDAVSIAFKNCETKDNKFLESVINTSLLPKMRNLGFKIPENFRFEFKNDKEKEEIRKKEDEGNKLMADTVKILSDAGYKVDVNYIMERTGIPLEQVKEVLPKTINKDLQNKLNSLYEL